MSDMDFHIPLPAQTIRSRRPPPKLVTADLYNVCNRIKEIDPALVIKLDEGAPKPWIIYEDRDGREQLVKRYEELTPAILEDLRMMASIPFMERYEKLCKEIDADNAAGDTGMPPEQFERFAWDFRNALIKNGLSHSPYYTSYRPRVRA